MSISKKLPSYEDKVNELINKGGSVSVNKESEKNDIQHVQLRLPSNVIRKIDLSCRDDRYQVKKSRHSWILEAIIEKIDRDNVILLIIYCYKALNIFVSQTS